MTGRSWERELASGQHVACTGARGRHRRGDVHHRCSRAIFKLWRGDRRVCSRGGDHERMDRKSKCEWEEAFVLYTKIPSSLLPFMHFFFF